MEVDECNITNLELDQACVIFKTENLTSNAWIYALMSDCVLCPFKKITQLVSGKNTSIVFSSAKSWTWRIFNDSAVDNMMLSTDKSDLICELSPNLGQFGLYGVRVDVEKCEITTIKEPTNIWTPLVTILAVLIGILSIISLGRMAVKRWKRRNAVIKSEDIEMRVVKKRIQSIDTFRGISILTMIFINNGAGGYKILEHATWDGLYIGDLVFPCFVWIMGVCIPIALSSQLSRGVPRLKISMNIIRRSCLLFFFGVCLNTLGNEAPKLERIRIFGVLQRFGIAYLIVGLLYALMSPRKTKTFERGLFSCMNDFLSLLPQWIVMLLILTGHCVITFRLQVPKCPLAYVGPGGYHDSGQWFNCTGGASGYLDKIILGIDHLYQRPTIVEVYGSGSFDPEGILGCLTTIFQTFLGVQAGKILRVHGTWSSRVLRWMFLAIVCGSLGAILHFRNIVLVNKNLWSISFVCVTTSFALVLLTICYLLVDVTRIWNGGPFTAPGKNALVMYIGHQMCYQIFPFHWKYRTMTSHMWRSISALWDIILWTIIAYILHQKRVYISL